MSRTKEQYAAEIYAAEEHRRRQANSSDGDAELLGVMIVCAGYACYKAVEGAVKVTVTGSKIIENVYKIGTGQIEILGTEPESKITYIAKHPSPRGPTNVNQPNATNPVDPSEQTPPNTPTSKREKAKIYGKKLVDSAKIGAKTLSNAYKVTTGKIEVVGPGSDFNSNGKEKFIFSDPIQRIVIQKELKRDDGYKCGIALEETIETSLMLRLNNKHIVRNKEFRSMILPDTTQDVGGTFELSLILKYSDGSMSKDDPAFLKIHYGRDGKLNKLLLPNTPIIFYNQWYPALTVYKGKLCSLPVNSGYYKYLYKKILRK
ncbi:hypothetical protein [Rickettsia felis]|uniref:hypothetical protein n=1 Tax=Rickettsia felis TaxID=42862 RepID=UPI000A8E303C|nr:hypothetical protein [Rickettsia felis]